MREIMSKEVVSCGPDSSVEEAEEAMRQFEIRRLPIVDDHGKLVGAFPP